MQCQDRDCGSTPVYASQRSSAPAMTQGSASGHAICVKRRMRSRRSIVRCRRLFRTPASMSTMAHRTYSSCMSAIRRQQRKALRPTSASSSTALIGSTVARGAQLDRGLLRLVPITPQRPSSLEGVSCAARKCRVHEASTLHVRMIYVIPVRYRVIIALSLRRFTYVVDDRERAFCDR